MSRLKLISPAGIETGSAVLNGGEVQLGHFESEGGEATPGSAGICGICVAVLADDATARLGLGESLTSLFHRQVWRTLHLHFRLPSINRTTRESCTLPDIREGTVFGSRIASSSSSTLSVRSLNTGLTFSLVLVTLPSGSCFHNQIYFKFAANQRS
jgi:hypothetical protein